MAAVVVVGEVALHFKQQQFFNHIPSKTCERVGKSRWTESIVVFGCLIDMLARRHVRSCMHVVCIPLSAVAAQQTELIELSCTQFIMACNAIGRFPHYDRTDKSAIHLVKVSVLK